MVFGVEVALDDDVEVADLSLPTRIETEAAVEGVDMLVSQFNGLPPAKLASETPRGR